MRNAARKLICETRRVQTSPIVPVTLYFACAGLGLGMKRCGVIAVLAIAWMAQAEAGDQAGKGALPVAAPQTWAGAYVGLNLGVAGGDSDWRVLASSALFADAVAGNSFSEPAVGPLGGIQAGYNFQSGPLVFGVEVLANGGLVRGQQLSRFVTGAMDDLLQVDVRAVLAAAGRVGYAWNNSLAYVKGGVAAALIHASAKDTTAPFTGSGSDSNWRLGPTIGVGLEYAVNRTVSVALEYNYIHLSDADYQLGDSTGTYRWRIDVPDIHWIAVRLNYRFN
jgi:outer membrane immunogenic protein